jgi:class 3 adenylate cyclase
MPKIPVGSVAIAKRVSGVCDPGEVGVCYEVYRRAGRL